MSDSSDTQSNEKVYLSIPPAHLAYAQQFGIEKERKGRYFVRGNVAPELSSYIVKPARRKDYANEIKKQCPCCGAEMVLRKRKSDNELFYGCSSFPYCYGSKPFS
mgnify:CR=1 FL=1